MAYRTATFDGAAAFHDSAGASGTGRVLRAVVRHALFAAGAVTTVAVVGGAVVLSVIWFLGSNNVTKPYIPNKAQSGPATLALGYDASATGSISSGFEAAWKRSQNSRLAGGRPLIVDVPASAQKAVVAAKVTPVEVARLEPPVAAAKPIPLPIARPALPHVELARAPAPQPVQEPAPKPAPQLASLAPPPSPAPVEKHATPQITPPVAPSVSPMGALTDSVSRTAVYDITNATVYLPGGQKLEAHSGLYDKMDDPSSSKVRMRGVTPPNVYVLTEREALFHGVRAIRLNPVDRARMYGRDGILAHTYMLGPNGQSNGCVSFKNYDKFLQAFLDGKVDKLVVVGNLGNTSWKTAAMQADGVNVPARRYASGAPSRARSYARFFGREEPAYTPELGYAPSDRNAGLF